MERIGLIDLGSNTARLVVFEIREGGYFTIVDEMKESVRLGEMDKDNFLKSTRILQAINALKVFQNVCELNNVDKIYALATAAVRTAKNQKAFLSEVAASTGIKLRVLSETEECNYVYQGVINSMDIPKGLIMEIGGGSTKFVYYNRRNVLHQCLLPFGAVTLTEQFNDPTKKPEENAQAIENFVRKQLESVEWLKEVEPDVRLIGVGGSFRNLARISHKIKKYSLDLIHNYQLNLTDFDSIYGMIKVLDLDKKMKIRGLSSVRADVFPSALSAIKSFIDYMNFPEMTISGSGLREGFMFNHAVPMTLEKPISDVLGHSLHTFITFLGENENHCEQVYNLCIQLFKQLRVLHKFPRQYIKILRACALMHDAGRTFKFYNHEKHTSYMLLNAGLYGLSHRDTVMAAFVTAIYNKDDPNIAEWSKYRDLINDEDIDSARKLAVILKLAVAFDKSNSNVVVEINCDVLGDSVIMKTELQGNASLEMKDALKAAFDFRKVFKKNLEIL